MEIQKKLLTRVRLINWHYFENETITFNGSTLVSGENTAGKSTILDAVQLVLTTNTRKFNTAANEKGNRNLRGYVRCKVGNVGEVYLRKNSVISNVALEFYEEKTQRYFVLGVHMTSADEESAVATKWYIEECRLEAFSFLAGNKPALANEFQVNGKKIRYIEQKQAAKERFKRRMGNLEDRFFDIIPKSLAFKPMDNVKDFINKFVLSQVEIDVESLRTNIETLSELEELIEKSNQKLSLLSQIVERYEEIKQKEKDILINELLLERAHLDFLQEEIKRLTQGVENNKQYIRSNEESIQNIRTQIRDTEASLLELNLAKKENKASALIEAANRKIHELEQKILNTRSISGQLEEALGKVRNFLKALRQLDRTILDQQELALLGSAREEKDKIMVMQKLKNESGQHLRDIQSQDAGLQYQINKITTQMDQLQERMRQLEKRKLEYPWYTTALKNAIEEELARRGIKRKVYVAAELLEVTDPKWQNAVEAYFNTQKFNLIVDPSDYDIALKVYYRNQNKIHTAGIVNTKKLDQERSVDNQSLAYVIHSENRYAKAYANYVCGRVVRCNTIEELEQHKIAMTADCMLYQGFVVRNIDKETYRNPFIGQNAYRVQIENTKQELEEKAKLRAEWREEKGKLADAIAAGTKVNCELMETYLNAPYLLKRAEDQMQEAEIELEEANHDPTLIELTLRIDKVSEEKDQLEKQKDGLTKENTRLETLVGQVETLLTSHKNDLTVQSRAHEEKADANLAAKKDADKKYDLNRKTKSPKTIEDNFSPQRAQFINEKDELLNGNEGLTVHQERFNHRFDQDFLRGMQGMRDYIDAKSQLEAVELVRFGEQLLKAKEDCEQVFKNDFLAKMKENIDNAKNEFKSLNKALRDIYYGDDSYHFLITFDKKKESLYRMITSQNNMEGNPLFTQAFEADYKEEMEELFAKLVTKDDQGKKVIEEYTDYRSYLDYDIEIHKKNGTVQKFSDIYGEKSGSETQVPYYVAIAASFFQLYRLGNSVRLMLLDEAFDKMDDDRISSMLEFFGSLHLQVIMATPPSKIETIGEQVDTILAAIRIGSRSIVEEYDL